VNRPLIERHEIFTVENWEAKVIYYWFNPSTRSASGTSAEHGETGSQSATSRAKSQTQAAA
jgi:hypothetical protein